MTRENDFDDVKNTRFSRRFMLIPVANVALYANRMFPSLSSNLSRVYSRTETSIDPSI